MNDLQLFVILRTLLLNELSAMGLSNVEVAQGYQPTQQGVPEGPIIYLHKLMTQKYGNPIESNVYNEQTGQFDTEYKMWRKVPFQVNGRSQLDPSDLNALTASDLVNTVADIMQLPSVQQTLLTNGIGIDRIGEVKTVYDLNDKDRFEQVPTFDFVLSYNKNYTSSAAAVDTVDHDIYRV